MSTTSYLMPASAVLSLPELDIQHDAIFRVIDRIKPGCLENQPLPLDAITDLLDIMDRHFDFESALAAQIGLDFAHHKSLHDTVTRSVRHAIDQVAQGKRNPSSFLRFIEYWFERHIETEDRSLAEAVKAYYARQGLTTSP